MIKFRETNGGFKNRSEILKVPRFSAKIFEQAAGFLRIYNGAEPLDGTFIHPERYEVLEGWAKKNSTKLKDLISDKEVIEKLSRNNF